MTAIRMPALFVGHGSPMNAIDNNVYSKEWERIATTFPKPKAILSISAHWYTNGIRVNDQEKPKMIYDMYGFPNELYEVVYNPMGAPELAHRIKEKLGDIVKIDNTWGIDHGTWSVLRRMYPDVDIPVLQLSIDGNLKAEEHYEIGKILSFLRQEGVMILGSGNIVHNLGRVNWDIEGGYPWATDFDTYIKEKIVQGQHQEVIHYHNAGESSKLAFVTPEHFYPLLYVLGASSEGDQLRIFNDSCTLGSISMTSYLFE